MRTPARTALPRPVRIVLALMLVQLLIGLLPLRAQAASMPASPAPLQLTVAAPFQPLNGHLAQLLDDSKQLDIAAIRALPDGAFTPLAAKANAGYRDTVLWLRFTLERSAEAPARWWLVVGPAYLDRVSLFPAQALDGEGREITLNSNWSQRHIPTRSAAFAMDVTGAPQTFFLRVENATALQAVPVLWQPLAYQQHSVRMALLHGGVFVTALVIVLINLFYWAGIRQPLFLWYLTFVGSSAFVLMQTEGYLPFLLQPDAPYPDKVILVLSQLVAVLSFHGLFACFVKPEQFWPRSCRAVAVLLFLLAVLVPGLLLRHQPALAAQIEWGSVFCLFLANMLSSFYLALRGERRALRYLLCFSVLILLIVLHVVELFGLVSLNLDFSSLFVGACLIHWVLLQLVVIGEINRLRREHESARDRALAQSLAMEKTLERRVAQRTAELARAEQQLRQALEDEKETTAAHHQFLRLVSHEFQTPLSVISGSAEMLSERGEDSFLRQRVVRRIQNATAKMNELVERALQIDHTHSAAWRANARDFRLDTLIADVVKSVQILEPDNERIRVNCPALALRADPELLGIAVQNLLLNALKYSPCQAPVTIRVHSADGQVKIEVSDQGDGVPLSQQKAIFAKYYRHHNGDSGLGLGLYLVDHIMRLHGGGVEVVSTPGHGSCFTLLLPLPLPTASA